MASLMYDSGLKKLWDGSIDLDTDTIKCALVTSSYTVDQTNHDFFNDITNEVVGTGYSAGGATLAGPPTVGIGGSAGAHKIYFDANDVAWSSSTITARAAIIYKSTGVSSTSPLIAYIDFGSDYTSTNGTFTIAWAAAGLFYYG